jgi:hypothetical protein
MQSILVGWYEPFGSFKDFCQPMGLGGRHSGIQPIPMNELAHAYIAYLNMTINCAEHKYKQNRTTT